jgi:uncharacterized protein YndB with AHSA1/START domain
VIDVKQQINAVRRTVGTRELEAGTARVATISQVYDTDLEDLWDAVTSVERIPRWFLPISGDLRVGGRYQLEGNAGGTVQTCEPPTGFSATWEYGGAVSWIEVRLSPEDDGRTRFELEHVGHVDDDLWVQFGPGAAGVGWDSGLMGLFLHISTGGAPAADPQATMAWMASAEGRDFMASSSDAWCEASIAAGEDPAIARAAADRTTAAYTAAPE